MKVMTLMGTRPEIIRLSRVIAKLDSVCNHILVYTNQNYDYNLSGKFFDEMNIRKPNYYFNIKSNSFAEFLSHSFIEFEKILLAERPDRLLVLGDTNSGLLTLIANRFKIPIYHMEAGNRCFDERTPEEINRKLIDTLSTYNLPYTEDSKNILLRDGFHPNFVFKTGNPIFEVIRHYEKQIDNSDILSKLGVISDQYVLVTLHRSENVDNLHTLKGIINAINIIADEYEVILSLHPRTKDKINKYNLKLSPSIIVSEPFGFFDFVNLEQNAVCVITDSGTVQEECCILHTPALIIRNTTERRETIECGASILCGTDINDILQSFKYSITMDTNWSIPNDYIKTNVADIVVNILVGK